MLNFVDFTKFFLHALLIRSKLMNKKEDIGWRKEWFLKDHTHNPPPHTHTMVEVINEFSKTAGDKINIQNSVEFWYTSNGQPEKEIKRTILFTIASKRIK